MSGTISLAQASAIVDGTLAKGRELGLRPLAVAVVDPGGHIVVQMREDGPGFMRAQIAPAKAWGVLAFGAPSSRMIEGVARERPNLAMAFSGLSQGRIVPAAGGISIVDDEGRVLGAVGVSGDTSDNDEICALHGIEAAGLQPMPAPLAN